MKRRKGKPKGKKGIQHISEGFAVASDFFEQVKALFVDSSLVEQPFPVYRWRKGKRRYFTIGEKGLVNWFNSVTETISAVIPEGLGLQIWRANKGWKEAEAEAKAAAHYGTWLHILITEFLIEGRADLKELQSKLKLYLEKEKIDCETEGWADKAGRDLMAFAQFAADYKLRPVAIELVLCSFEHRIAGAIDCAAYMRIPQPSLSGETYKSGPRKGEPRKSKKDVETLFLLDWKSGRKGFQETHEIQLELYRTIWMENFPDLEVKSIANWSPKDWRTNPSYNFSEHTDKHSEGEIKAILELAPYRIAPEPAGESVLPEVLELGKEPETLGYLTAADIVGREFENAER